MNAETLPSDQQFVWQPPPLHVTSTPPRLLSQSTLEPDPQFPGNFPRNAKWCGDGSSLMVQCENRSLHVFETSSNERFSESRVSFAHSKTLVQPSPIVDFAWYPGASPRNLPSYCFVASVRDCPVKLLDGRDGRLRASYPIVDHRERQIAPHCLAFNLTAQKLYCGFEDAIEVFDVQKPGEGDRLQTTPSKKSKDGLKGIISSIAFSYSPDYYAAGSLTPASHRSDNIALFSESVLEPVLPVGGIADLEKGGVTQLMFNPTQPHILFASFRRSERLWSWDLRGDASIPLCCFSREETFNEPARNNLTNQKSRFDVDSTGRWLASGNQMGKIAMYDLLTSEEIDVPRAEQNEDTGREVRQSRPALAYVAHNDGIGGVAFHPLEPVLVSVSGSRHFDEGESSDSDDSNSAESSGGDSETSGCDDRGYVIKRMRMRPQPSVRDASIKVWSFSTVEGL